MKFKREKLTKFNAKLMVTHASGPAFLCLIEKAKKHFCSLAKMSLYFWNSSVIFSCFYQPNVAHGDD